MSDKLAVILLDALGPGVIVDQQTVPGFEFIRGAYRRNGDVLGISSLPHTAQSNPLIWGGFINVDKFWVQPQDDGEWIDPAVLFEHRGKRHNREDAAKYRNYDRSDFDQAFVWDVLDAAGYDPVALQVPICLPPYSYNADAVDQESWFPDTEERMAAHIREKPALIRDHAEAGYDLLCTSIQMPDKWLHGVPEGKCDEAFVREESWELDDQIERTVATLEAEGYDWLMLGDHGAPTAGRMPVHAAQAILPRHRKEAVIFGSDGLDLPRYSADVYDWLLGYFDEPDADVEADLSQSVPSLPPDADADVQERLENLGYL